MTTKDVPGQRGGRAAADHAEDREMRVGEVGIIMDGDNPPGIDHAKDVG